MFESTFASRATNSIDNTFSWQIINKGLSPSLSILKVVHQIYQCCAIFWRIQLIKKTQQQEQLKKSKGKSHLHHCTWSLIINSLLITTYNTCIWKQSKTVQLTSNRGKGGPMVWTGLATITVSPSPVNLIYQSTDDFTWFFNEKVDKYTDKLKSALFPIKNYFLYFCSNRKNVLKLDKVFKCTYHYFLQPLLELPCTFDLLKDYKRKNQQGNTPDTNQ